MRVQTIFSRFLNLPTVHNLTFYIFDVGMLNAHAGRFFRLISRRSPSGLMAGGGNKLNVVWDSIIKYYWDGLELPTFSLRSSDHAFLTFGSAYRRLPKQA
jgi:hypothetical protein